jgi:hypothetical protein
MRHSRSTTTLDVYAQTVSTAQRRALQQLAAFAQGEIKPAELETADLDLDFSTGAEARSNSRSKTFQLN